MRLVKRSCEGDLELVTFENENVPPYAILSHTWTEGQEVSYQELVDRRELDKAGYDKIRSCVQRAAEDGLQYCWIDTCCIDKTSSAELQEAINSMFAWYSNAIVCYVYLSDVADANSVEDEDSQFHRAHWHSRGWTLQELLAPRNINFYAYDWTFIGTKDSLCTQLYAVTRIQVDILKGDALISTASVAQRMSWASQRKTARVEDTAYCLMGIFSVNMTMLYGEGEKAFLRLQEEICKESSDNSIFVWQNVDGNESGKVCCGLLATHPRHFRDSWAVSSEDGGFDIPNPVYIAHTPLSMVNQGIQMRSYLLTLRSSRPEIRILVLRCRTTSPSHADKGHLGILIQRRRVPGCGFVYVRVRSDTLTLSKHRPHLTQKITLAKAGIFPDNVYDDLEDLHASRYELGPVCPRESTSLYLDVEPVYVSQGNLTSWGVVAWTALHRFYGYEDAAVRMPLGHITFCRDDGEQFVIQLAVRKNITTSRLFSTDHMAYVGEVSWVQDPGPEIWVPEGRRIDCGETHLVYVYVDSIDELRDIIAQRRYDVWLFFAFLIRIRPTTPYVVQ